jgi:hypothetical protein
MGEADASFFYRSDSYVRKRKRVFRRSESWSRFFTGLPSRSAAWVVVRDNTCQATNPAQGLDAVKKEKAMF